MTDLEQNLSYEAQGPLLKVRELSSDRLTVFGVLRNGNYLSFTCTHDLGFKVGDVAILSQDSATKAPRTLWSDEQNLGEILKVNASEVILDSNQYGPKIFPRPDGLSLEIGNTVVYNEFDEILRVIDSEPLLKNFREGDATDPSVFRKVPNPDEQLTFSDFAGYPEVIAKAREFIEIPFERVSELDAIRAKPVRGVLFSGPPGTGKTHLARIIAHVAEAEFYLVNGPELVTKYFGDSERLLRRLFKEAASHERAIIFFDEIDSIGGIRAADSHEASNRLVTQFLTEMDGFHPSDNVIVIGATNRPDQLDSALLRSGRFDWEIEFGLPSLQDRYEMLRLKARSYSTKGELHLEVIADRCSGWSGADLDLLWKDAALVAAGNTRRAIRYEDLAFSIERLNSRPRRTHTY